MGDERPTVRTLMERDEALALIRNRLEKVIGAPVDITIDSDLLEEEIIDSLDGLLLLSEIEEATGVTFPEDEDLVELGVYKVRNLVDRLS